MPHSLIGCSGWSQAKPKYFAHFSTVELQSTFYEPPSVALATKWRASAPPSFHFCLKAWQLITHTPSSPTYRRLKSQLSPSERDLVGSFRPTEQVTLAWERTAAIARALEARVVLFQCPASFSATTENVTNLRGFFSSLKPEQFKLAWEPRGDWPLTLVANICEEFQLLRCVDPLSIDPAETRASYWRLHGKDSYRHRYTDEELDQLLRLVRENLPQYVFFNNVWMKDDSLRFLERVRKE